MYYKINSRYSGLKETILSIPELFEKSSEVIMNNRNTIKVIETRGLRLNVKSFKVPNIINRIAYKYVRPSKARRSFEYALKLLSNGINTPEPIAFIEYSNFLGLTNSYYISIQEDCDYTFRDIIGKNIEEIKELLIDFTKFTYYIHSKGVYFIDHSPGNTLIKKLDKGFRFSLVDLNRTKFFNKALDLDLGIKNFYRLGSTPEMVEIMAEEYARLCEADVERVCSKMMQMTMEHNSKVLKKKQRRASLNKKVFV